MKMKNMLLGGIVVLLVGLLWYTQVYGKMEHQASKSKASAHAAEKTAANLRQQLSSTSAKNKKNGTGPSDAVMLEAVPADPNEAAFLRDMNGLIATSGVTLVNLNPSVPAGSGAAPYDSINVSVNVKGSEDQIARFMAGLHAMKRVFVLDNVTISQDKGTNATGGGASLAGGGVLFTGQAFNGTFTGRLFAQAGATAPSGVAPGSGRSTTPVTGAPAPTGGLNGTQNG